MTQQVTPDGKWRWDGSRWTENVPTMAESTRDLAQAMGVVTGPLRRRFGGWWRYCNGTGAKVVIENGYVLVKGAPGQAQARVPLRDIETVTVQREARGSGPMGRRFTMVQLIGRGTVLGEAALNTPMGWARSKVADQVADWLRGQLSGFKG